MFTVVVTFSISDELTNYVLGPDLMLLFFLFFFWGGGQRQGYWGHILLKTPKMALISEYLAADLPADAYADALCIINIGYFGRISAI